MSDPLAKERARRQKNVRKRARSRGRSARLIRRRGRSERISTSVPTLPRTLAGTLALSYIPKTLLSPFLKDIFNKESPPETSTYPVASAGDRQHRLQGPLFTPLPHPPPSSTSLSCSSSVFRTSPLAPSPFIRSLSHLLFSKEREKEKPAAALPMGKRRGSRFKSRIFRGRKAVRLLKAEQEKKARRSRSFSSSLLLPSRGGGRERKGWMKKRRSRLRVDATRGSRPRRGTEREVLITRRARSRETHLSAKLRQEIPAFIPHLEIQASYSRTLSQDSPCTDFVQSFFFSLFLYDVLRLISVLVTILKALNVE